MSDVESNVYLNANMTYESPAIPQQTIENVGIRLRGAAAKKVSKKKTIYKL